MKSKTFSEKIQKLGEIRAEAGRLIREACREEPVLIGSLHEVLRTCGKPTCRCAREPCHRCLTLMTTRKGKRRCQVVRKADRQEVRAKVRRYRRFRELLRRLKGLDSQRYALLNDLLQERNEWYE